MKNTNTPEENEMPKDVDSLEPIAPDGVEQLSSSVVDRRTFIRGSIATTAGLALGVGNSESAAQAPSVAKPPAAPAINTWDKIAAGRIKTIYDKYVATIDINPDVIDYTRDYVPLLASAMTQLQTHYKMKKSELYDLSAGLDNAAGTNELRRQFGEKQSEIVAIQQEIKLNGSTPALLDENKKALSELSEITKKMSAVSSKIKIDYTYTTEANALEALAKAIYTLSKRRTVLYEIATKKNAVTGANKELLAKDFTAQRKAAEAEAHQLLVRYGLESAKIDAATAQYLNRERSENLVPAWDPAVVTLKNGNKPHYSDFLTEYPNINTIIEKKEREMNALEREIEVEAADLDAAKARKETWGLWSKKQRIIPMWRSLSTHYNLRNKAVAAYIYHKQDPANPAKKAEWEKQQKECNARFK